MKNRVPRTLNYIKGYFFILTSTLLLLVSCQTKTESSQDYDPSAFIPDFTSTEDQIGDYITDMLQAKNGDYWFSTAFRGISQYNGDSLITYTQTDGIAHNTVLDIDEDLEGNIWMATRGGLTKFDGKAFQNYYKEDGLLSTDASCVFADNNGILWIGSGDGVCKYDGKEFTHFPLPNPDIPNGENNPDGVLTIIADKEGNLWFGRDGYGVCKYDGEAFSHITENDGLHSNNVVSIFQDSKGVFWFGSLETSQEDLTGMLVYNGNGGLSRSDGNQIITFRDIEGLTGHDLWDIREDQEGKIWVAPKNRGAYYYDGTSFTQLPQSMQVTDHSCVQSLLSDQEGNLWFGFAGGVHRLENNKLINITKKGPWLKVEG